MSFATVSCKSVFILFHTPFKTLVYPTQNRQSKVFAAMIEQQKTSVEAAETEFRFAELPAPTRLTVQTSAKDTDLRKGIDGLAMLVRQEFDLDSFTNTLLLFELVPAYAGPFVRSRWRLQAQQANRIVIGFFVYRPYSVAGINDKSLADIHFILFQNRKMFGGIFRRGGSFYFYGV